MKSSIFNKNLLITVASVSVICCCTSYLLGVGLFALFIPRKMQDNFNRAIISQIPAPPQMEHYVIKEEGNLALLWQSSNIRVNITGNKQAITAANNVLFVLGRTHPIGSGGVIAIDGTDGQTILWRSNGRNRNQGPSGIYASPSALFIGSVGIADMGAYDLQTGKRLWRKRLSLDRGVWHIYEKNERLFVKTSQRYNLLESTSGKIIGSALYDIKRLPSDDTIQASYFSYHVFSQGMSINWNSQFNDVKARDWQTGQHLWQISNVQGEIAATQDAIYLVKDDRLSAINPRTTREIAFAQFDSPTSGHVAVDADAGRVYVVLNDSWQLFAFEILAEEE